MTSRHALLTTVGSTHASKVIAVVNCSDAALPIVTTALEPLNVSALPYLPELLQIAPLTVPLFPLPDASLTVVPLPSLNPYAATNPVDAARVVALATGEYPLRFPAASVARTR